MNGFNGDTGHYSSSLQQIELLDRIVKFPQYGVTTDLLYVFNIAGDLDVSMLIRALYRLIERHPLLSTAVTKTRAGWGIQECNLDIPNQLITFNSIEDVIEFGEKNILDSTDIFKGVTLFRTAICRINTGHALIVHCNHLVFDGWSYLIMCRDLSFFYNFADSHPTGLPVVKLSYTDFVYNQRKTRNNKLSLAKKYWCKRLKGYDGPKFLFGSQNSSEGGVCDEHNEILPDPAEHAVKKLATENRVSVFSILLCATAAAFCRLTGRKSILTGSNDANRSDPGFSNTVGFFTNTRLTLIELFENTTLEELLRESRKDWINMMDHFEGVYGSDILNSIDAPEILKINNLELPGLSDSKMIGDFAGNLNFGNTIASRVAIKKKIVLLKLLEFTWTPRNGKQALWSIYRSPVTSDFIKEVVEITCKIINQPKAKIQDL